MTREEIIQLARESGWTEYSLLHPVEVQRLERFAEYVESVYAAGAAAEREMCAKVCEETTASWTQHLYNEGCMDCAKAIRARGQG